MTMPRYDEQRVDTRPLPDVRVPTNVPLSPVAHLNINKIESVADSLYQREKEKANQIAVMGADSKAAELETKILYDPDTGVLNMKGRNSLEGKEAFQSAWKQGMDEIGADLHNDTQRLAFQRSALARYSSMHETVSRHISSEIENYDDTQTQSLVTNEANAATAAAVRGVTLAGAADRSTMAIARQRAALMDFAARKGLSDDKRTEMLDKVTSQTHAMVVDRMLSNEDDITAKKYFDEFKDQLVGTDLINVGKAVEASSLRGEAQRTTDTIMSQFKDNRQGAIDAAKKVTDPRLRDDVETRVAHEFELRAAIQREKENDLYLQATNTIEPLVKRGVPFIAANAVPLNIWSQLPINARTALERRALHADSDYPNNPQVWHSFLELTPQQLGSLDRMDFESKYWGSFDRETRARAEIMWASARDAFRTGKMDAKMAGDETFKDLVKMSISTTDPVYQKKAAKDLTPDQYKYYTDFTIEAMKRKEAAEATKGKPLTRVEMQDVMDGLVKERIFIDKPMAHDPVRLPGEVSHDEQKRAYVPLASIPEGVRNELTNMVPKGTPQRKIERLYAARLMNDRVLFQNILKEK